MAEQLPANDLVFAVNCGAQVKPLQATKVVREQFQDGGIQSALKTTILGRARRSRDGLNGVMYVSLLSSCKTPPPKADSPDRHFIVTWQYHLHVITWWTAGGADEAYLFICEWIPISAQTKRRRNTRWCERGQTPQLCLYCWAIWFVNSSQWKDPGNTRK